MRALFVLVVLSIAFVVPQTPASACGGPDGLKAAIEKANKKLSKREEARKRRAEAREEREMTAKGFVKMYTACGPGTYIWMKPPELKPKPVS